MNRIICCLLVSFFSLAMPTQAQVMMKIDANLPKDFKCPVPERVNGKVLKRKTKVENPRGGGAAMTTYTYTEETIYQKRNGAYVTEDCDAFVCKAHEKCVISDKQVNEATKQVARSTTDNIKNAMKGNNFLKGLGLP
jgi:hypothetical protein|tara:strand:+ start:803 stop:1213 length:411 start_codon:yes stop_codon:yes gene_type:complete